MAHDRIVTPSISLLCVPRWQKEQAENALAWKEYYRQVRLAQAAWVIEQYRIYTMRYGWYIAGNHVRRLCRAGAVPVVGESAVVAVTTSCVCLCTCYLQYVDYYTGQASYEWPNYSVEQSNKAVKLQVTPCFA